MRVLTITPELPQADRPNTMAPVARQIESLRSAGIDMQVLQVVGIPVLKYLHQPFVQRQFLNSVDLIHAHFGYCGWVARSQFKKPVVVSFMGSDLQGVVIRNGRISAFSKVMVRCNRRLARMVDGVIVKSASMASVVAPSHAHVVPNGVDMQKFQPRNRDEARRQLGWKLNTRYILFPGNPDDPRKGFRWAKAAVDYAQQAVRRPLEIVALRRVPADRVPLYMNASDLMMMVSLHEGSPNVVKEAMACDLPIVSVPVGDVCELLDGVAGCIVCSRDSEQLGQAIVDTLFGEVRATGRAAIERRSLDLQSVAEQIIGIYEVTLNGRSRNGKQ